MDVDRRYSAAVVGCGTGGLLSIEGLEASERFEVRAVADLSEAALERVGRDHPKVARFRSHRELLRECPTDILCVSTYAPSHLAITRDALEAGALRGILVEKPLADTLAGAREIARLVDAAGIPAVVPHGLLAAAHSTEIIRLVRAGAIGRLEFVDIQCDGWDIISAGIHWFNFFVALAGDDPVVSVQCACDTSTGTFRDGMQVETESITYVETRSGLRCVLQAGDHVRTTRAGKGTFFRLVGADGTIEFYGWESLYRLVNREWPAGQTVSVTPFDRTNHRIHLEKLAELMDERRRDSAPVSGSLTALEICLAAYLSNRERCKVTLPIEGFAPRRFDRWDPGAPYGGSGGGRDGRRLSEG